MLVYDRTTSHLQSHLLAMDPPIILVSDFEENPPITLRYVNGDNELDFETVYVNINRLCDHSGRGRLETSTVSGAVPSLQLKECDEEFLDAFWSCGANLCDYFAEFFTSDTAVMQSMWFHMLEKLQQAAILPHQFWLPAVPSCEHAEAFEKDWASFHHVINSLAVPRKTGLFGSIVCPPHLLNARLNIDLGDNKDGLGRWQQFLYRGSPGFTVPEAERVYARTTQDAPDPTAFEVHVPRAGLALVEKHTERLRLLAERLAEGESQTDDEASASVPLDQKTLNLKHESTYTSIDGRQVLTQPMYPRPEAERAPRHGPNLEDPSFDLTNPCFQHVNECIGVLKGGDVFRHADDDRYFHMLSVGSPDVLQNWSSQSRVDRAAYVDIYDDWTPIT
ncbi:hypothetical protein BU23DRAFT_306979 [Bimuria novae-zelandiae CBS 107.79]|uniref:Uncharacterized protein n=1 Tax=Bimuria novae-zelandiae CBS 107.79 TaxID=1447943 RepID=A0A6A5UR80_9PLEO|nr:hypothetical protein BU23DRAFT_306979 [Bimuria novae-zelandiae CBS 107.79]